MAKNNPRWVNGSWVNGSWVTSPMGHGSQKVTHCQLCTSGKKFMCDKCDKQFRHSSTLSKHLKIHDGVKPCACSACDYRSSQKWNLDSRLQSRHMCEKPYGCDECDSNLSVQGNDFSRPCVSKLEIKPNRLSHILHLYGFSPVGCPAPSFSTLLT